MEKRISYNDFQSIKRVAQACNPLMVSRDKIKTKLDKLTQDYKDVDNQIAALEAGVKQVYGFRVEELVKKVIESGVDCNGQPKKSTKYLPTAIVSYDENHRQYVITTPDVETMTPVEDTPAVDTTSGEEASTTDNMVDTPFSIPETSTESIFD